MMQQANKNLKIIYTLTDCSDRVQGCRFGRIDDELIKSEVIDYMERYFYICGPPGMVNAMRSILTDKLFLPSEKIITENFTGY